MSMLPEEPYKRIPVLLFYAVLALAGVYLFMRFLFPVVFPFILAWLIAFALRPLICKLHDRARIPIKLSAPILVILVTAAVTALCYFAVSRIYGELTELAEGAARFIDKARDEPEFAAKWIRKINAFIPFVDAEDWLTDLWNNIDLRLRSATAGILERLTSRILPLLADVIAFIPNAIMYVFIIVFSSYYFAVDFDGVNRAVLRLLPKSIRRYAPGAKKELSGTFGKLLRAYGIIILLTFTELFILLSLVGVKYSLIIAFLTSIVDILPVLGTGTVLIPWGIWLLIIGNTGKGFAILGIYAFITVIREIVEPRLIGKSFGIHPLAALVSMYVGLRIFGIAGMIFLPVGVTLVRNIVSKARSESGGKPLAEPKPSE